MLQNINEKKQRMDFIILFTFLLFNANRFLSIRSERPDYNKFQKSKYCECKTLGFKQKARIFNSSGVVPKSVMKFLGD